MRRFLENEEKILRIASPRTYHKSPTRSQKADFSPPSNTVRESTADTSEQMGREVGLIQEDSGPDPSAFSVPRSSHESLIESWGLFKGSEDDIDSSRCSPAEKLAILKKEESSEDLVLDDFF